MFCPGLSFRWETLFSVDNNNSDTPIWKFGPMLQINLAIVFRIIYNFSFNFYDTPGCQDEQAKSR